MKASYLIVLCCVGCRLGVDDRSLERSLARAGCEVHCFDPSLKQPHLQQEEMWLHRLSVDWRDPNPAIVAKRQYANTKKLATILNDFGHREVGGKRTTSLAIQSAIMTSPGILWKWFSFLSQ